MYWSVTIAILLSFFTPYKVHYHLMGMLATNGQPMVFSGSIEHNILTGRGNIKTSNAQGMRCTGSSLAKNHSLSCNGVTGTATLMCEDGRKLTANWALKDCDSGVGSGEDDQGHPFVYAIGATDSQAKSLFKTLSLPH